MRLWKAPLAIALVPVLVWLAGSAAARGSQAAQPIAVTEARALTTLTSTVYLPFIAKPAPTVPYVLVKIKLPPGSHPHGIALDLNGKRAFVGNHQANTLSVIDTAAMTLAATIALPAAAA